MLNPQLPSENADTGRQSKTVKSNDRKKPTKPTLDYKAPVIPTSDRFHNFTVPSPQLPSVNTDTGRQKQRKEQQHTKETTKPDSKQQSSCDSNNRQGLLFHNPQSSTAVSKHRHRQTVRNRRKSNNRQKEAPNRPKTTKLLSFQQQTGSITSQSSIPYCRLYTQTVRNRAKSNRQKKPTKPTQDYKAPVIPASDRVFSFHCPPTAVCKHRHRQSVSLTA